MAEIYRERSIADDHAALSYERSVSDNLVGAVRRGIDCRQRKVFWIKVLEHHLRLSNYVFRIGGDDAVDTAQYLS